MYRMLQNWLATDSDEGLWRRVPFFRKPLTLATQGNDNVHAGI
jgi:hypothetical protein